MYQWWKHTCFYEIYVMSFCDADGNGIGDIPGILSKLPYLKELGVGGIWLTPFYPSPKVDNGYDVSDYYGVDPIYGTIRNFEEMVAEAHGLGIKVIIDMVVNHTSVQHPWFLEAVSSKNSPKRDWYIWKDPVKESRPGNWESFFGGSAWELDAVSGQYYYHSFAKEQADLNWRNPEVENAVFQVLDHWLSKGVDGFRFDVMNNLSVSDSFEDNPVSPDGVQLHKHDVNQSGISETILRICQHVRKRKADAFLVGEISSDELEQIHSYAASGGLDTTFNFNLGSRENFQLNEIMAELKRMQTLYRCRELPTLFFGSHDMGRFPDRFSFTKGKIKCLLALMMVCRGIPFLYFGDELGMKNRVLHSIEEANDVQGILAYETSIREGRTTAEAIRILNEKSRDASRNFMDWEEVKRQKAEPASIWNFTRQLIKIRSERKELTEGSMELRQPAPDTMEIIRDLKNKGTAIQIILNFSDYEVTVDVKTNSRVILASEDSVTCRRDDLDDCIGWQKEEVSCMENGEIMLPPGSCVILEVL